MNIGALRALVIGLAVLILIVFAAVVYGMSGSRARIATVRWPGMRQAVWLPVCARAPSTCPRDANSATPKAAETG